LTRDNKFGEPTLPDKTSKTSQSLKADQSTLVHVWRKIIHVRPSQFLQRVSKDFVHRFILDRIFVDFTVSLLVLPFYIVDFNSKIIKNSETVKSTVKP
jgi:hypothetical protein